MLVNNKAKFIASVFLAFLALYYLASQYIFLFRVIDVQMGINISHTVNYIYIADILPQVLLTPLWVILSTSLLCFIIVSFMKNSELKNSIMIGVATFVLLDLVHYIFVMIPFYNFSELITQCGDLKFFGSGGMSFTGILFNSWPALIFLAVIMISNRFGRPYSYGGLLTVKAFIAFILLANTILMFHVLFVRDYVDFGNGNGKMLIINHIYLDLGKNFISPFIRLMPDSKIINEKVNLVEIRRESSRPVYYPDAMPTGFIQDSGIDFKKFAENVILATYKKNNGCLQGILYFQSYKQLYENDREQRNFNTIEEYLSVSGKKEYSSEIDLGISGANSSYLVRSSNSGTQQLIFKTEDEVFHRIVLLGASGLRDDSKKKILMEFATSLSKE
jgi:hypothetical protein